jgi:hypothetical protein
MVLCEMVMWAKTWTSGLVTRKGVLAFWRFSIWEVDKTEHSCHRELGNPEARNHIFCGGIVDGHVWGHEGKGRTCGSIHV